MKPCEISSISVKSHQPDEIFMKSGEILRNPQKPNVSRNPVHTTMGSGCPLAFRRVCAYMAGGSFQLYYLDLRIWWPRMIRVHRHGSSELQI